MRWRRQESPLLPKSGTAAPAPFSAHKCIVRDERDGNRTRVSGWKMPTQITQGRGGSFILDQALMGNGENPGGRGPVTREWDLLGLDRKADTN